MTRFQSNSLAKKSAPLGNHVQSKKNAQTYFGSEAFQQNENPFTISSHSFLENFYLWTYTQGIANDDTKILRGKWLSVINTLQSSNPKFLSAFPPTLHAKDRQEMHIGDITIILNDLNDPYSILVFKKGNKVEREGSASKEAIVGNLNYTEPVTRIYSDTTIHENSKIEDIRGRQSQQEYFLKCIDAILSQTDEVTIEISSIRQQFQQGGVFFEFQKDYIPTPADIRVLSDLLSKYHEAFQNILRGTSIQNSPTIFANVRELSNTLLPIIKAQNAQNEQKETIKNRGLKTPENPEKIETEYNILMKIGKTEPLVLCHPKLKNKALYTPSAYLEKINEILQILESIYIQSLRDDYLPRYEEVNQENAILQQLNALISKDSQKIIAAFNLEQSQLNYANYTFLLSDRLNQEKREDQDKESNSILKGDARARSVKNLLSAAAEAREQMLRFAPNR